MTIKAALAGSGCIASNQFVDVVAPEVSMSGRARRSTAWVIGNRLLTLLFSVPDPQLPENPYLYYLGFFLSQHQCC